jgi:hypothetical protein
MCSGRAYIRLYKGRAYIQLYIQWDIDVQLYYGLLCISECSPTSLILLVGIYNDDLACDIACIIWMMAY